MTPEGGQGPPTSLPFPPTSRENLKLDGYLEYPHATKALYIFKHPGLFQDLNPDPTAQQSASPTTILDNRLTHFKKVRLIRNIAHFDDRTFELSIDLACIAALHG
ncbi:uncharacterized protein TNCV_4672591 [Trichonephila clavipes]|nr:uncharacterized protein TNCV_4672591 [Trichonephila clavipes]